MPYKQGYSSLSDPDAADPRDRFKEYDTFVCVHGNEMIIVERSGSVNIWSPPEKIALIGTANDPEVEARRRAATGKRQRGFCMRCMGPTCGREKCVPCVPWEAKLEAQEGSRQFWKGVKVI